MFIPLHDDTALRIIRFQLVNGALIAINVAVLLYSHLFLGDPGEARFQLATGIIPAVLYHRAALPAGLGLMPEQLTLLTYMFVHADWFHLLSNMLFLWVFGDNVEDALGHIKYLVFYVVCGIAAGLVHAYMLPESKLPLIGASGAVAGVIGAYLVLHPRVLVWVLAFRFIPLKIPAAWVLGVWVATQLVMVLVNQSDQVAWWAHIGGVVTGAILVVFMRRPGVPLFDRWHGAA